MDTSLWNTQDLNLAATLKTLGANMVSVTLDEVGRWQFNFEKHQDLQAAVQGFYDRTLMVEPSTLLLNIRSLRREGQDATNADF